jgi:hypothetical protein
MESRTEWMDAPLNDLVERPDKSFDGLEQGQLDLRSEMHALRRDLGVATAVLLAVIIGTGILT